jgi:hypothetical protein
MVGDGEGVVSLAQVTKQTLTTHSHFQPPVLAEMPCEAYVLYESIWLVPVSLCIQIP